MTDIDSAADMVGVQLVGHLVRLEGPMTASDGCIVTQLALDIPAGRPFRVENRGWLPADAACLWSLEAVS